MSLLRADFTSHRYAPHTHDAFVIAVTEQGGAEVSSARAVDKVGPATLFVSNPEERQSARIGESSRWLYRSFYLTEPAIVRVCHGLGTRAMPWFSRSMINDADLIDRFARLHRALESENHGLLHEELFLDAFGALLWRHSGSVIRVPSPPHDSAMARRVIEQMRARYAHNLNLAELAGAAGLTSFQLIGLFKRTVGLTPHAYLIQVRLSVACRLLRDGYSAVESALAAGFCDQSALTRHFKRCYGITPVQFAAASRFG
jgi:AraC-like DNA-binding protein